MAQASSTDHETPILREFPPLFRNRNFLLLWAGYVVSALGDRIHFLVMLMLLKQLKHLPHAGTRETAQLNIMMLLPFLLIGPFSGVIADRLPRRLVMIGADFARVAVVIIARTLFLAVPAGMHNPVPGLPGVSWAVLTLLLSELLLATFSAFFSPARTALLPNLVHPNQLMRANSMTNAAGTIASLVGFIIGGALVAWHLEMAMYVDAGTFFVSGVLLLLMRREPQPAAVVTRTPAVREPRRGFVREFAEGIRYLLAHRRAGQIILLLFLFWCGGAIILSGLTGVVTNKFGMTEEYFGYFLGIVGIGMMAGAASCSLARRGIAKEVGIAWSMTLVGVCLLLFSLPRTWQWALFFLVLAGFFGAILLVTLDTLLQRFVPDYVRGRVMAARDMLANVGLVGVAVPLAIDPNIDHYIMLVLRILALVIIIVGVWLTILYYRGTLLPLPLAIARRFVSAFLTLWHGYHRGNACRIPTQGAVIFVANHTTAADPLYMIASSRRRFVQFMMAREYYEKKPLHWMYKLLKIIPVNRTGNDTASIRAALRALKDGGCIGMFPEGGISEDGRMREGRQGVALLALASGATVVPAYIQGTNTYSSMVGDFLKRAQVTVYFGTPLRFPELAGKERDAEARAEVTQRVMGAIIALRERYETNLERRMSGAEWEAKRSNSE